MEIKIDKRLIDEAVQDAVAEIKQNFIEKSAIDDIRRILSQNRIATDKYGEVVMWDDIKRVLEDKGYEQECDDCISRKAVLELAAKGNLVSNSNYESVRKAINNLPSVSIRNQRWIPISERLPEKEGRYLCTVGSNHRNPREMYYAPQEWAKESDNATWRSTDGSYVYDWFVEAWMPLPEPYKEVKADASNE